MSASVTTLFVAKVSITDVVGIGCHGNEVNVLTIAARTAFWGYFFAEEIGFEGDAEEVRSGIWLSVFG